MHCTGRARSRRQGVLAGYLCIVAAPCSSCAKHAPLDSLGCTGAGGHSLDIVLGGARLVWSKSDPWIFFANYRYNVARAARAREGAIGVGARRVGTAIVHCEGALVDVGTREPVPARARGTRAVCDGATAHRGD
eukprot:244735-Rhodomonas_salina.1